VKGGVGRFGCYSVLFFFFCTEASGFLGLDKWALEFDLIFAYEHVGHWVGCRGLGLCCCDVATRRSVAIVDYPCSIVQ